MSKRRTKHPRGVSPLDRKLMELAQWAMDNDVSYETVRDRMFGDRTMEERVRAGIDKTAAANLPAYHVERLLDAILAELRA